MNSNYDFRTLHEGFLKDIFDIVTDTTKSDSFDIYQKLKGIVPNVTNRPNGDTKRLTQNIAKATKGLTATFPLVVTEATPVDQAQMVAKAVERKCCSLLQMLFAANQISSATSASDYISKFHKNLDADDYDLSSYTVDDVIENTYDGLNENVEYGYLIKEAIKEINEDCKENIHYHLGEGLNETPINSYIVRKVFDEAQIISAPVNNSDMSTTIDVNDPNDPSHTYRITDRRTTSNSPIRPDDIYKSYQMLNTSIVSSDVKKANEATPSLLIVNFKTVGASANDIINTCIIGVKVVIHYVSSEDMSNKLVMKNTDKRGLFNFIRATTREISFFKDFLFSVDRAKVDALSKVGKGSTSSLWKMLELRAHNREWTKANLKSKSDSSCASIATIVISKAEAELIKKFHRIDVAKPSTLLSIMRGYSFMCAAIIDETSEKVDFLWDDGSKDFETISFMSLEREDAGGGVYKKVINMMAKGR